MMAHVSSLACAHCELSSGLEAKCLGDEDDGDAGGWFVVDDYGLGEQASRVADALHACVFPRQAVLAYAAEECLSDFLDRQRGSLPSEALVRSRRDAIRSLGQGLSEFFAGADVEF